MQALDRFKSHPPLPANDSWVEDYESNALPNPTQPNLPTPSLAQGILDQSALPQTGSSQKISRSGKTIQAPGAKKHKSALGADSIAPIPASLPRDTHTEAQKIEERQREQEALKRDHQAAWAVLQEASSGGSQGDPQLTDSLANVPRRSRYASQTSTLGSTAGESVSAPFSATGSQKECRRIKQRFPRSPNEENQDLCRFKESNHVNIFNLILDLFTIQS